MVKKPFNWMELWCKRITLSLLPAGTIYWSYLSVFHHLTHRQAEVGLVFAVNRVGEVLVAGLR